jgi:hypothetical protein
MGALAPRAWVMINEQNKTVNETTPNRLKNIVASPSLNLMISRMLWLAVMVVNHNGSRPDLALQITWSINRACGRL